MKHTLETVRQIWDDECGERVDVGPDRDGLGCVEVRCVDTDGKIGARVTMNPAQALLVAEAIKVCAVELGGAE